MKYDFILQEIYHPLHAGLHTATSGNSENMAESPSALTGSIRGRQFLYELGYLLMLRHYVIAGRL